MRAYAESDLEDAALGWFEELGYAVLHGQDIGPEGPAAERGGRDCVGLAGQRDAPLPRLLSGELRVRDTEKLVGANSR